MPSPFDQHRYQVRFEWGAEGFARLAPADIVVVVDVLGLSTDTTNALDPAKNTTSDAAGLAAATRDAAPGDTAAENAALDAATLDAATPEVAGVVGAGVVGAAAAAEAIVLLGCLRNASAIARAVLDEQTRRADRTSIAVIAVGERDDRGILHFAVEDLLGAGAVIDALTKLGIDHTSPEAAVAAEGFHGLRRATRHLLTAGGSGQALLDGGAREVVLDAAAVDAASVVPRLADGVFIAA